MPIPLLIKLFRQAGKPECTNDRFEGQLNFSKKNKDLLQSLKDYNSIRFDELEIDGQDFNDASLLPETGKQIRFNVKLPTSDLNRFFTSTQDMVEKSKEKISKGEMPEQFYIVDIDYSFDEDPAEKAPELIKLKQLCQFIKQLSELAHYHDSKKASGFHKLVFILSNDSAGRPSIVIETRIGYDLLKDNSFPDITILEELSMGADQPDLHFTEKKNIFYSSLSEFLNSLKIDSELYFPALINDWEKFSTIYQNNLGTYLSGFAFHKARKEIAEAELKLAEDFSKVISDITGKLLSIPLSVIFVVTIFKSKSLTESLILMLGLLLTSIIVTVSVCTQNRQLDRIKNAKDLIFEAFQGKKKLYPNDLNDKIYSMESILNKNQTNLEWILTIYKIMGWIPFLAGLIILIYRYDCLNKLLIILAPCL